MHITLNRLYFKFKILKTFLPVILICMSLSACDAPVNDKNEKKVYYDLKGFIENQIVYLNEKKAPVTKTVHLNGKKEVQSGLQVDWKKELELFAQADINKPAYNKSYAVIRSDSSVYEYKLKPNENLPVRYLMIKVDSATQQPLLVKAILKSENKIYNAEREIILTSAHRDNLLEVTNYSVKGYQKLIMMDAKSFDITAKIGL